MHRIIVRSAFVVAAGLAGLALVAGSVATSTASAACTDHSDACTTSFSFTYDTTDEIDTSCGFEVHFSNVGKAMGRASATRVDITNAGVITFTNPAIDGLFVTQKYQILFKNRAFVTDAATGFESFDSTTVGPLTLYDMNGTVLLRNQGPVTIHLVMDPSLEYPESLISQEITFEHGAHDGYCETLAAALHFDV
jgi:hypothetical protein